MFGSSRRRAFDGQGSELNSTGYSEKTVFTTDFGSPENSNYQNAAPQGGSAQSSLFGEPVAQDNAYAPSTPKVELPMVFASRENSDMYIYEYPDRLEWYVRTSTCMLLVRTAKKQ
ncbi:MAG: hypothetical protein J1F71_02435 [Clostridiales bacterium]|nr:hypothetical protein [Clostridiales bacterium]